METEGGGGRGGGGGSGGGEPGRGDVRRKMSKTHKRGEKDRGKFTVRGGARAARARRNGKRLLEGLMEPTRLQADSAWKERGGGVTLGRVHRMCYRGGGRKHDKAVGVSGKVGGGYENRNGCRRKRSCL